jgi:hypothetical protein
MTQLVSRWDISKKHVAGVLPAGGLYASNIIWCQFSTAVPQTFHKLHLRSNVASSQVLGFVPTLMRIK